MTYLFKIARRLSVGWHNSLLLLLLLIAGCSPGETRDFLSPNPGVTPIVSAVSISPKVGSVLPGETIHFTAKITDTKGRAVVQEVDWSATGGVIQPDGTFLSDDKGIFSVRVRARLQPDIGDSAQVSVFTTPSDVLLLTLSPDSALVYEGEALLLDATARLADGSLLQSPPLAWSATGGSVDGAGWFSAASEGDYTVTAQASSEVKGNATVQVRKVRNFLTGLSVSPAVATVGTGQSLQFAVAGSWSAGGSTEPKVVWNSTGGTISNQGLFTADSRAGNFKVIARERSGILADTAFVSITEPVITKVTVSPTTSKLVPGASQQFNATATLNDGSTRSVGVNWSAGGGGITASGLYTAGSTTGDFTVAASTAGTSLADSAGVEISSPTATVSQLIVNPSTVSVPSGEERQFYATALWTDGSVTAAPVTWNATGGSITGGGLYQAGTTQGTYSVVALDASGLADTSIVTITAPVLTKLVLAPETAVLQRNASAQFTVEGTWSDGSAGAPEVQYSAAGGSITASGSFIATGDPGTYRIIASHTGSHIADTSLVTIEVPAPTLLSLQIAPTAVTIAPGAVRQFAVSGAWSDGGTASPPVTWSATGGTVTATGLYTAGTNPGTYAVVAKQADGSLTSSATVNVTETAPSLTTVSISPSSTTLQPNGTRQFSVSGTWSDGSTAAPVVSWSASGGTVTNGGLYVAGSAPGTFSVIARHLGGERADTAQVIIVSPPELIALAVNPDSAVLSPGATAQFTVLGTYSNGGTGTPSVAWSATGGVVSSSGLYTAGSTPGTFRIVASAGGLADTSRVVLGTGASVTGFTISPDAVTLSPGATQQFQASAVWSDGLDRPVGVVWTATGGRIDVSGLYSAGTLAGTFMVVASCSCGAVDTATVLAATAPPSLTQVVVNPRTVSLQPGSTQQFTLIEFWSDGSTSTPSATFSIPSAAGAVTAAGLFTAGTTPGQYLLVATDITSGQADSSLITVQAPAATSVALSVRRWNTDSGTVLVSNGIPLQPGALMPSDLGQVRLFVSGVEQSIHVAALGGRHRDGSLRSILVQFQYDLPRFGDLLGSLELTGGRSTPDFAGGPTSPDPIATALPTSADYLVATNLAGPMITVAAAGALTLPSALDAMETDFPAKATTIWSNYGPTYKRGIAVYDHPLTHYQHWFRTGDATWWRRATAMALNYRNYLVPRGNDVAPWMANTESLVLHYWLTGDEVTRNEISVVANTMLEQCRGPQYDEPDNAYWIGGTLGDDRMRSRCLMSAIDANLVDAPLTSSIVGGYTSRNRVREALNDLLPTQAPSGAFGGTYYKGGQKNYMVGMLLTAIVRYHDEIDPDPRIPGVIKKAVDYLWSTQWIPSAQGFQYISNNLTPTEGGTGPEPGLNGLILPGFSWYYRYSGDVTYRAQSDALVQGVRLRANEWVGFPMQLDQAFYRLGNYLYDRQAP